MSDAGRLLKINAKGVMEQRYKMKVKEISSKFALPVFIVSIIFTLDRFSKIYILNHFEESSSSIFINNILNFDLVWNNGIAFGLFGNDNNYIYHIITLLILIVIIFIFYLLLKSKNYEKFFFSLILGGAIGNFYDRITYFAVPDFIDLHYNELHWFTFNVADIFITIGVIFLLFYEFSKKDN